MTRTLSVWWEQVVVGALQVNQHGEMRFAYPDLSPRLAMKIAKRVTLEEIGPATWPAFVEDIGLAGPFVRRRVTELAEAVIAQASSIPETLAPAGLDLAALNEYSAVVVSRAERVARTAVAPAAPSQVAAEGPAPRTRWRKPKGGPR